MKPVVINAAGTVNMKRAVACCAVVLSLSQAATGADVRAPRPGTLVRVTAPTFSPAPLIGTFVETNERGLLLLQPQIGTKVIPLDAMTRLQWSEGRRNNAARYGLFAAGGLGVIGAVACADQGAGGAAFCGLGGVAAGAIYGSLVGLFVKSYNWRESPLPKRQLSVVPAIRPGAGLGVALTIRW